jgi:membrane-bound serine protease (ClpP class)
MIASMGRVRSVLALATLATLASTGSPVAAQSSGTTPVAVLIDLDGVVDPFTASHVEGRIDQANQERAAAILVSIDTPGGLDSSMRTIIQAILGSGVPVICYVAPEGARAASAGTFILIACPVAAMAPGTNVGAAHPVGVSGAINLQKAENDAAAYIRSLAERYGRNADWAERAVRESVSASAREALALGVIDVISPSIPALLEEVDGRTVRVAAGRTVRLETAGVALERPNLAFIFFWLGIAFVAIEFFVPGGVLGVLGGVMLVLAFMALGMLPVQLIGVLLLVASVAFFILELKLPGHLIGTVAGLVSLVLGGLFLFDPAVPSAQVSPWVIAPVAVFAAVFFLVVIRAAIRMRGGRPASGMAPLVGAEGTVVTDLDPSGIVQVASEEWTAEPQGGPVPRGARIRVVAVEGLRLKVVAVEGTKEPSQAPAGSGGREGGTG